MGQTDHEYTAYFGGIWYTCNALGTERGVQLALIGRYFKVRGIRKGLNKEMVEMMDARYRLQRTKASPPPHTHTHYQTGECGQVVNLHLSFSIRKCAYLSCPHRRGED